MNWYLAFHQDEDAATAVEYAVMLALIIVTALATISSLGQALGGKFTFIDSEIQAHSP
jgi:Flp pilus assembly pilin Flp